MAMLEGRKNKIAILVGSGLTMLAVAIFCSTLFITPERGWLSQWLGKKVAVPDLSEAKKTDSLVLQLVSLPIEKRVSQLEKIALGQPSEDKNRASYLLAADLITQGKGEEALKWLENLEQEYTLLAPQIAFKRSQAYKLIGDEEKTQAIYQQILSQYPQSPVAAEVLYILGKEDVLYWEQAMEQFPNHPRTHEIIRQRLEANPEQVDLLLLLAKHDLDAPDVGEIRDRLFHDYGAQLTPQDWEILAKGYWQQWQYGKAGDAFANAPPNPQNVYFTARGRHLMGRSAAAKKAYEKLINEFPDAQETGLGLRRLASLSPAQEAIEHLEVVIDKFPAQAAEALLAKANILEKLGSTKSADQDRQKVLDQYPDSDAASEYRWEIAQKKAAGGNLLKAWEWAGPIVSNNPDSSIAAKAGFWVGKWARQLEREQDAKQAFEHVLAHHPQSYYAWRSAVMLGWDVGSFQTVRQMTPQIVKPNVRPSPPAGSEAFKELFQLGQDDEAGVLFQAEIRNQPEINVAEQFTQGLLKITKGNNLQGISLVWNLTQREKPEDVEEWQSLRLTPQYWHALFPLPYHQTIRNWSQQRQLNPLLVTSVIRQESRFEREIRSSAGAVGLMQVMPGTGSWVAEQINLEDYSLTNPEDNVNLGTWYLHHTHQQYGDNSLLAVASYNAGPGNVAKWIQEYGFEDQDKFVEQIPFPETKGYVEAVFSNYWNYLRLYNPEVGKLLSE